MKSFMKRVSIALAISALAAIGSFASDKNKVETKTVTFPENVMVNGTLVKAGEYQVRFDESAGELSIIKNGKVKAKSPAHVEARTDKVKESRFRTQEQAGNAELIALTFAGARRDIIVGGRAAASSTQ